MARAGDRLNDEEDGRFRLDNALEERTGGPESVSFSQLQAVKGASAYAIAQVWHGRRCLAEVETWSCMYAEVLCLSTGEDAKISVVRGCPRR